MRGPVILRSAFKTSFPRSGTVKVEEVDDLTHPSLGERGHIGISLYQAATRSSMRALQCKQWVNKKRNSPRGRVDCVIPCPSSYKKVETLLSKTQGFCSGNDFPSKVCVIANHRRKVNLGFVECCYDLRNKTLITRAENGAGRSLPSEILINSSVLEDEENAYRNCCSIQDKSSCELFHSVRPVCTSDGWKDADEDDWGEFYLMLYTFDPMWYNNSLK